MGEYYIEVDKWNSLTGNPVLIEWETA
jgi:hypothetical protein